MSGADPFTTLGIVPTLDREAIKRAYFDAVRRTPPHVSPEGFRRVRNAYEQLNDGASLVRAWLSAPLDAGREIARWNARFSGRIAAACAAERGLADTARSVELLIDRCTRTRIG